MGGGDKQSFNKLRGTEADLQNIASATKIQKKRTGTYSQKSTNNHRISSSNGAISSSRLTVSINTGGGGA